MEKIKTITNDLISIIVPVYNVEKLLPECLESIINQTYKDIEIICINDGSTDKSLEILKEYEQKDNRIKIINKQNGGLSSARNAGLNIFTGDYVFFLDSDDYIHPETLKILYDCLKQTKTEISECNYFTTNQRNYDFEILKNKNKFSIIKNPLKAYAQRKKNITPSVWKRLYSKEIIKDMRFIEGIVWEDVPFTIELYKKIDKISQINLPLYYYWQNPSSISNSQHSKFKYDCHFKNMIFINDFLSNNQYIKQKCIGLLTRRILNDLKKIKDKELKQYIQQNFKDLYQRKIISFKGLEIKKYLLLWKFLNERF